jgi:Fe(3+) dicitrate transport protein
LFPDAYKAGAQFNPAPDDWFLTERKAVDITHDWQINPDVSLQTLAFWSDMYRDYWRFQLNSANPTTTNADGYRVWNFSDEVLGNNRSFDRLGLDSRMSISHSTFGIGNEAELGIRLMHEELLDQTVAADRATPRQPNQPLLQDRLDSADSLALYVQNRFDLTDVFTLTAGLRMETYEQKRENRLGAGATDSYSNTELMPGLGATYQVAPAAQVFASVYRAFAPPLVGSVLGSDKPPTKAESSINVELGVRGSSGRVRYEVAAFQIDFANQVEPGVSGIRDPNEGSALIQGLEAGLGYDLGHGFRVDGNFTWIPTAEYGEDRPGEALKGNRLAYSPEWVANLSLAYQIGRLQTGLHFNYTGEVYGDGLNVKELTTESAGTWGGVIPSYYTIDLMGRYVVTSDFSLFGAIKNLTDEQYIAGLRQGIYVGPERSVELGANYRF